METLSKYHKKSSVTTALGVHNFIAGGPTIFELSSEGKVSLQSRRAEYSGN